MKYRIVKKKIKQTLITNWCSSINDWINIADEDYENPNSNGERGAIAIKFIRFDTDKLKVEVKKLKIKKIFVNLYFYKKYHKNLFLQYE